ncbi:hypothetical protein HYT00_02530 [Candidatus Giovannonibacteria bacterium]|nr:hypothetical protein [Candidatus Giovannonibacteria bacterium]
MRTRYYYILIVFAGIVSGCSAAGFGRLGDCVDLPDGTKTCSTYGKTPGVSGPDLTFAETYRCDGKCQIQSRYHGTAPGAVEVGVAGIGAATVTATGQGVAAYFLSKTKPTRINETNTFSNDANNGNSIGVDVDQSQSQKGGSAVAKGGGPVNVKVDNASSSASSSSSLSKGGSTGPITTFGGEGGKVVGSGNSMNKVDTGPTTVDVKAELKNIQSQRQMPRRPSTWHQDP